jgi:protein-disulfide isomerase
MDTAPATSSAPPVRPSPAAAAAGGFWTVVVPVLCLVVALGGWFQTRAELGALRTEVRDLMEAVRGPSSLDVSADPALGSDEALVTLVEFSDYECPFCIRHFSTTMPLINERLIATGRIQYVFKDFPIAQLHPEAVRAHHASRCAARQGRFWELHARLFSPAGSHTAEMLERRAVEAGVELEPFRACMNDRAIVEEIQESVDLAVRFGANGTPAFLVGLRDPRTNQVRVVQAISGAHPYEEFERVIADVERMQTSGAGSR